MRSGSGLLRGESTISEAADRAGVDRSTVMKLRTVAKQARSRRSRRRGRASRRAAWDPELVEARLQPKHAERSPATPTSDGCWRDTPCDRSDEEQGVRPSARVRVTSRKLSVARSGYARAVCDGGSAMRRVDALELSGLSAVAFARMSPGVPDGQAVVLDVAQLQALLARTFNVELDVGRGKEPVALVRFATREGLDRCRRGQRAGRPNRSRSNVESARSRSRRPRRWRCMRRRSTECPTRCFTSLRGRWRSSPASQRSSPIRARPITTCCWTHALQAATGLAQLSAQPLSAGGDSPRHSRRDAVVREKSGVLTCQLHLNRSRAS